MKQDLLTKGFSLPTLIYWQYFLYRIRQFVLNWFIMCVSDDWKYLYVCGCRLYACIIIRQLFRYVFHYPKITYPQSEIGFPYLKEHISLVICIPLPRKHISVLNMCSSTWETQITRVIIPSGVQPPDLALMPASFSYSPATWNLFDNPVWW